MADEMKQQKLAYPASARLSGVECPKKPKHVWTVFAEPVIPMQLVHLHGAFHEDEVHDWRWAKGRLYYYSRIMDQDNWLVLEYAD